MLAWIGAIAIVALFGLIITKRLSPLVALIVVPVAASLAAGFETATGKFIVHGVQNIGPIAGMFVLRFFFGILTDAGMLDPIIAGVLRVIGCHPPRIVMETGAARAADPSRRLGRRHVSRHAARDDAALYAARDGSPHPRVRGVDGGRRQFPAVGRADAARIGGAAHSRLRDLHADDSGADRRAVFVFGTAYVLGVREAKRLSSIVPARRRSRSRRGR